MDYLASKYYSYSPLCAEVSITLKIKKFKENGRDYHYKASGTFVRNLFLSQPISASMVIGIISDTHDRLGMVKKAISLFKEADITTVLHAGDYISPFVVPLLGDFQVYGTFGNNDGEKKGLLRQFDDIGAVVKEYFCEVHLDGLTIAVAHGHIHRLLDVLIESQLYGLIVTGHTHEADIREGEPVVINPGECCGYLSDRCTVAVFDTRKRKGEIIEVR